MPLHLDLLHLEVGNRGQQLRVPVDQPLVLVDQARAVELDEHLEHRARQALVHGEALARPVAGGAEPLQLVDDGAARLRLPGPHLLEELLAAERAPARLLALHQLALDHHLGRDAGMVGARLPEHVAPAHALEAAQHVLQRVVERVAHVERAGDVGRRDDDAIGRGRAPARAGRHGRRPPPPRRRRCGPRHRRADRSCRSSWFRFRVTARYKARHAPALSTSACSPRMGRLNHRKSPNALTSRTPRASPPAALAQNPDPLDRAARARGLCQPGAGAGDRFAAAADRRRFRHQRRRRRDRGHRLCDRPRLDPAPDRPGRRPLRQIPDHHAHRRRYPPSW